MFSFGTKKPNKERYGNYFRIVLLGCSNISEKVILHKYLTTMMKKSVYFNENILNFITNSNNGTEDDDDDKFKTPVKKSKKKSKKYIQEELKKDFKGFFDEKKGAMGVSEKRIQELKSQSDKRIGHINPGFNPFKKGLDEKQIINQFEHAPEPKTPIVKRFFKDKIFNELTSPRSGDDEEQVEQKKEMKKVHEQHKVLMRQIRNTRYRRINKRGKGKGRSRSQSVAIVPRPIKRIKKKSTDDVGVKSPSSASSSNQVPSSLVSLKLSSPGNTSSNSAEKVKEKKKYPRHTRHNYPQKRFPQRRKNSIRVSVRPYNKRFSSTLDKKSIAFITKKRNKLYSSGMDSPLSPPISPRLGGDDEEEDVMALPEKKSSKKRKIIHGGVNNYSLDFEERKRGLEFSFESDPVYEEQKNYNHFQYLLKKNNNHKVLINKYKQLLKDTREENINGINKYLEKYNVEKASLHILQQKHKHLNEYKQRLVTKNNIDKKKWFSMKEEKKVIVTKLENAKKNVYFLHGVMSNCLKTIVSKEKDCTLSLEENKKREEERFEFIKKFVKKFIRGIEIFNNFSSKNGLKVFHELKDYENRNSIFVDDQNLFLLFYKFFNLDRTSVIEFLTYKKNEKILKQLISYYFEENINHEDDNNSFLYYLVPFLRHFRTPKEGQKLIHLVDIFSEIFYLKKKDYLKKKTRTASDFLNFGIGVLLLNTNLHNVNARKNRFFNPKKMFMEGLSSQFSETYLNNVYNHIRKNDPFKLDVDNDIINQSSSIFGNSKKELIIYYKKNFFEINFLNETYKTISRRLNFHNNNFTNNPNKSINNNFLIDEEINYVEFLKNSNYFLLLWNGTKQQLKEIKKFLKVFKVFIKNILPNYRDRLILLNYSKVNINFQVHFPFVNLFDLNFNIFFERIYNTILKFDLKRSRQIRRSSGINGDTYGKGNILKEVEKYIESKRISFKKLNFNELLNLPTLYI